MTYRTEDQIRDEAKIILGFDEIENGVQQGTGQITTFNQLGFKGVVDKPDGWYLPDDAGQPAIILETKSEAEELKEKYEKELFKNIDIVLNKYSKVIGILYNGKEVKVYKNKELLEEVSEKLEPKTYYLALFTEEKLDKNHIYEVTQRINNSLHFKFGMTDLQDRMIFTACALVAQRYNPKNGLQRLKDMDYSTFHNWIYSAIAKAIESDKRQNDKLNILLEEYSAVRMSITEDQDAINDFINNVCEISDLINSQQWNGEDVMSIFFNEFNRYRGKADAGQVFTPDHITSFMYRLIDVHMNDKVLDATCGSGAFLVKSMANMIREAGGPMTEKAKEIKAKQLFGIEMYRKIYALACANFLIHKDGKTNLLHGDAKSLEAAEWIKEKGITKVLMNPPYERKNKCADIILNVLNSVPVGTECAFIMPDKKMEKETKLKNALKKHTLKMIVKLPENLFFGIGVTTSIFVFEAGKPQNGRNIIGYYIEDDGLETVKNKGRQDIKNKWEAIEDYWIQAIQDGNEPKHNTRQIINPAEHLSYQMPEKPFEIFEEDFVKCVMDYEMYKRGVDVKSFNEQLLQSVLYSSEVEEKDGETVIRLKGEGAKEAQEKAQNKTVKQKGHKKKIDITTAENKMEKEWKKYRIGDLFKISLSKDDIQPKLVNEGSFPLVSSGKENNGICAYIEKQDAKLWNAGLLTVDMFGKVFYQEKPFYCVSHGRVNILIPKKDMSEMSLRFIGAVIEKTTIEKYNFQEMCTGTKLAEEFVFLPSGDNGQPDLEGIEKFMCSIADNSRDTLSRITLSELQDIYKKVTFASGGRIWKRFRIKDIFVQERGKEKATKQNDEGDCPLIQETNSNNGLDRYVKPTKIFKKNAITISINYAQNVFFQESDFCASVNIAIIRNSHLNQYNGLFICSILQKKHANYDYTNKISKEKINEEEIFIPVDSSGNPDWDYMENYIKELITKTPKNIDLLSKVF